ncbi:AraC family transcriptional regulator ligand-binding domain-containing protein [Nocardia cyriacigeorgica]|uniref:AraC family transcriptional regulator n=1 Tax=Nocardia cyriacigeorgica TaxID=135487 RepID=UPI0018962F6D|nr:AraC family transcriptional regulator [Nocardia cyriacigeorgica]MBF6093192.1 AraC family transcriptional regulator ligand-binding domain-containing protein [Nocardia cyriacigeorgica]MBF6318435.1 AraC family transcriptional regulator ligand-binding domain-containing protein [Nocardia cyriacigeorgica]MBF6533897.1 AraC family transcriptional regulator ligand-binding domain-containing protein [Nocardia cyriacigeorgica]
MNEGSNSVSMARMLIKALSYAGMDASVFAHRPDMRPEVLADDRCRVSSSTIYSMWEQLITSDRGTTVGLDAAALVPVGHFGVWDYLFLAGENLIGSCGRALDHAHLVSDPGADQVEAIEDGALFTIQHRTAPYAPDVVEAIEFYAQALILRRAREATRRPITPVRVTLRQPPSQAHPRLVAAFGTTNIVYNAPCGSMTFLDDDARAPLPMSPPGLEYILLDHAELVYAASKPVLDWFGVFRSALDDAFVLDDAPTLTSVAQRLVMSPRSLQRRLAEQGTTWRAEVQAARRDRAIKLLRDTDLPLGTVAARLGYSDTRTLRRSVNRWLDATPATLRYRPVEEPD